MDVAAQLSAVLAGRYTIEREIGAGGMATVFLARDVKHNRNVALKVLRPELAAVLGPERFLSEINVTANLQHPHLLPLFDSGEANGLLFYVMPFVEGESLRDRLERERQLPVDEAVRIAVAVAGALEYAHQRKVIHRDLKPENILLQGGQPMITDFGIALAISNAGGARVTQTGLSLGTPQYMSPEQATGDRGVDGRSDIYSLAAVLYEMLTGDPPHMGNTVQAIIAKVLTDRPQHPRHMRDTVPEHVDAAVMQALAKVPADRFVTAGEFAEALTGARAVTVRSRVPSQNTVTYEVVPVTQQTRLSRFKPALMWAPAVMVAGLLGFLARMPERSSAGYPTLFEVTFSDSLDPATATGNLALSHDGSQLAVVGTNSAGERAIYLRRLDALDVQLIRGTEQGTSPEFSPDGTWLLFRSEDMLKKVPVGGGTPIVIADTTAGSGSGTSWGNRGEIVYVRFVGQGPGGGRGGRGGVGRPGGPGGRGRGGRGGGGGMGPRLSLWRVSEEGGTSTLLAFPDSARGHQRYSLPHLLPGGKDALITIHKRSAPDSAELDVGLGLVRLRDGRVTDLNVRGSNPRYLASGHIIFGRTGGVFAAPFDPAGLELTGPAVPVLENILTTPFGVSIATSDNGTLVYQSQRAGGQQEMVRVDRRGVVRPIGLDSANFMFPRIDPTGRRIALTINNEFAFDVWTFDLASSTATRLTRDTSSQRAEWTPDGQRIAYLVRSDSSRRSDSVRIDGARSEGSRSNVFMQPWDGSGRAELLLGGIVVQEMSFGPPGSFLAIRRGALAAGGDLWIAPLDSLRAMRPFLATTAAEGQPQISPNGRLLAYRSTETGSEEVYVRPLGVGGRIRISTTGGAEPTWAPNGRELFYRAPGYIMSAVITEQPELSVSRKDTLFADTYIRNGSSQNYDVFPSGEEFVFVRVVGRGKQGLFGITNWTEELKRRTQKR